MAVHRLIEARAASNGDRIAVAANGVSLSYRELNQRANAVARHLMASGFRRNSLATVRMPRCADTAVVLLAILKAGGMFVLLDDERDPDIAWPRGVSFAESTNADEVCYRNVDLTGVFERPVMSSANLPVISRASDVACVILDRDGTPLVLVPHSTIMALRDKPVPRFAEWTGEAGAFDLWMALMDGATVRLRDAVEALETAA